MSNFKVKHHPYTSIDLLFFNNQFILLQKRRKSKRKSVDKTARRLNAYLSEQAKVEPETAMKNVRARIEKLKTVSWIFAEEKGCTVQIVADRRALAEEELLGGCYVLKTSMANKDTINARDTCSYTAGRAFRATRLCWRRTEYALTRN